MYAVLVASRSFVTSQIQINCYLCSLSKKWRSPITFLHCWTAINGKSATTIVSVWNIRVFGAALTALTKPRTLWQRITRFPSPCRQVMLLTHLLYYTCGIHTIRMTCVLYSSQRLSLCCRRSHNAWRCICLSSADSHIVPLRYCYISDAALAPSMFGCEILPHIAIQSSLQIPRLPLHLLHHYRILQVWNIQSNLHTR